MRVASRIVVTYSSPHSLLFSSTTLSMSSGLVTRPVLSRIAIPSSVRPLTSTSMANWLCFSPDLQGLIREMRNSKSTSLHWCDNVFYQNKIWGMVPPIFIITVSFEDCVEKWKFNSTQCSIQHDRGVRRPKGVSSPTDSKRWGWVTLTWGGTAGFRLCLQISSVWTGCSLADRRVS